MPNCIITVICCRRTNNSTLIAQLTTFANENEEKKGTTVHSCPQEIKTVDCKEKIKKNPQKKFQTTIKVEAELNTLKQEEESHSFNVYDLNSLSTEKICEKLVDKNSILMQQLFSGIRSSAEDVKTVEINVEKESKTVKPKKVKNNVSPGKIVKKSKHLLEVDARKMVVHDIRKAPELTVQVENNINIKTDEKQENDKKHVAIKIKMCSVCNAHHLQDTCSLENPQHIVHDMITLQEWQERYKPLFDSDSFSTSELQDRMDSNTIKFSFAVMSLPSILCIKEMSKGWCVFTKEEIKLHTQFGPLIGKAVREVDIAEDSNMKDIWEIQSETIHGFINTENLEESNWMRFVRPAPSRNERNVGVVCKNDELYLMTIKNVHVGDELLYWQDSSVVSNKKKMEKTS